MNRGGLCVCGKLKQGLDMFSRVYKLGWEGFGLGGQVKSFGKRVLEGMK